MAQTTDEYGFPIGSPDAAQPAPTTVAPGAARLPVDEYGYPLGQPKSTAFEQPFPSSSSVPNWLMQGIGGAPRRIGQAFQEGYYGAPTLLNPDILKRLPAIPSAIAGAVIDLPQTALALGSGAFRAGQQIVQENVRELDPLTGLVGRLDPTGTGFGKTSGAGPLSRDVAAVPEAFAGSPETLRLPEAPLRPNAPPPIPRSSVDAGAIEDALYGQEGTPRPGSARASGATVSDSKVSKILDSLEPRSEEALGRAQASGSDVVEKARQRWEGFRGKPMSIDTYIGADKALTADIQRARVAGHTDDVSQLQDMQQKIRSQFENPDPSDIISGNPAGFEVLRDARKASTQRFKMETIEHMQDVAEGRVGPTTTALKTQLNNLANNEKKLAGWSDDEIAALKDAAKTGSTAGLMHALGSKLAVSFATVAPALAEMAMTHGLPSFEAMMGGLETGAGTYAIGGTARAAAKLLMERKMKNIFDVLGQSVPENPLYVQRPSAGMSSLLVPPPPAYDERRQR